MYSTLENMEITNLYMNNNNIKSAEYKLSQHRVQGENSVLNIFQVAKLMDTIRKGEDESDTQSNSIFFSLN